MSTAVVTGAGQGIGRHLADRLAREGYDLVLIDRDEVVRKVAEPLSARAEVVDTTDADAIAALAERVPVCAVLVNNAAITLYDTLLDTTAGRARRVLDVNVVGPFLLTRVLASALSADGGGSVINMSSITARSHPPGTGLYSTSKAALEALTRAFALELGPLGIRCNAIAPGTIPTEGSGSHYGDDSALERRAAVLPLRRLGSVEDIAEAVVFLASPQSAYITGQVLAVDGGFGVAGGHFYRLARGGPHGDQ